MKIFDCHIHLEEVLPKAEDILGKMAEAGVYGGCVFSYPPAEYSDKYCGKTKIIPAEQRAEDVISVTKDYPDRLFPVLWVHPAEEDIVNKVQLAADMGIDAFKIICSNFYVYEEKSMELLKAIAKTGKPVFFHTGILWDGQVSSNYNRPMNWEALIPIKGLRFAMGHCSWPWHDECIALYGKFLNALTVGDTAEMFLDMTPGTPDFYRDDLINKLFNIGYDFGHNLLFGTDCSADHYNSEWTAKWLKKDGELMDKYGVGKKVREDIYYNNLLRFLGKTEVKISNLSPVPDNANTWTAKGEDTREIIEYWYKKIGFNPKFDDEFYKALKEIEIPDYTRIETYDLDSQDGKKNLLSYLYMCEELKTVYEEKGISEEILLDNLKDISVWTDIWSEVKGELYLGELPWLSNHMTPRLFKLGRLQFCMSTLPQDIPSKGFKKGDKNIEIHIPERGPLNNDECVASISRAREFFKKYYPDYDYKCFTCDSWLLGSDPEEIVSPESNIGKFLRMFEIIHRHPHDSIVQYLFKWNTRWETVGEFEAKSSLAKEIQRRALEGKHFDEGFGIIEK